MPCPVLTEVDPSRIRDLIAADRFFWLDLVAPSAADVRAIGELLGLHDLAVEDSIRFGQRPKIDEFGDTSLVVCYGVMPGAAEKSPIDLHEVHMHVSGRFVCTIERRPLPVLAELRDTLAQVVDVAEQWVVYRILDALVDSFFPLLERIDASIDELEDSIIAGPEVTQLHAIFALKRSLVSMRRVVTPQRDLLARAIDGVATLPGLEAGRRDYFRDVYDHMIRISDTIDTYRDLLTGAMDVYLSTVANRQNEVMKQLSIVATIFLPLTFVTGFFGQNFGWLVSHVESEADFLAFGIGGVIVPCLALIVLFRRRDYL